MMKMLRVFTVVLLLTSMFASVQAAQVPVEIEGMWINDRDVFGGEVRGDILRGDRVDIEVKLRATSSADNLKVKAEISGFDHDDDEDVRDETNQFDVKSGQVYFKKLSLKLPSDLEQDTYSIRVEVTDRRNTPVAWDTMIDINTERHALEIEDVLFSPGLTVKAGRSLLTSVRVENNGEKDEEGVKVTFSIPDLGVSDSDFVDEVESDDEKTSEELFVRIPDCAAAGDYAATVTVSFDDAHRKVAKDYTVKVLGNERCQQAEEKTLISYNPEVQQVATGSEVSYPLLLTNAGTESRTYTVSVNTGDWASSSRVSSSVLVLAAGETKSVYTYATAKRDASPGEKLLTVSVKSGEQTVKDVTLKANVTGAARASFTENLQLGLIVLLVLIVIVGLIVGFSRWKGEEGKSEETYY